jgi:hypothetical protein
VAKAITILDPSQLKVGSSLLGKRKDRRGSPKEQVHDGDTIVVEANGNLSVRFLGIDAPEVSYTLPGEGKKDFAKISSSEWIKFLNDPLEGASDEYIASLGNELIEHLKTVTGEGCAKNHATHAEYAQRYLEDLIVKDMKVLGQDKDKFQFFMSFANDVMDGYGRLLCFLNRHQESAKKPEARPLTYNERMLAGGMASPYFIWPNVNPFRRQKTLVEAVPRPGELEEIANGAKGLGPVRNTVKEARTNERGIYERKDPLRLQSFELRFLADRRSPSRWVINLSDTTAKVLLKPVNYHIIPYSEDRLFIPAEFVPLFMEAGWQ